MIKKKFKTYITSWEAINKNITKMNINVFDKKVTMLGVYGISQDKASVKKEEFYRNLNSVINEIEIIKMGDFNVQLVIELEVKLWVLMESNE